MYTVILTAYIALYDRLRRLTFISLRSMLLMYLPGMNKWRDFHGKARAYVRFKQAVKLVPAYRDFISKHGFTTSGFSGLTTSLKTIPIMDKASYIQPYGMDARCLGGKVPATGVIIDESSGSSGKPTNWVRGIKERKQNARMIEFSIRKLFGKKPLFIINAFALGPWATGVNVTMSCVKFSMLKSLGPDKLKIENTLKHFGPKYQYIIMGYPPFLKMLVDQSDIQWKDYNISFIFGGESMSENMRDYLLNKGIRRMYSSLGASDLELNLAAENDFTIRLRRLLRDNDKLKAALLKFPGALPMIFQYNPADFYIESSEYGELIFTICRPGYLSPKIRYNIHDRGHVMSMKELYKHLDACGIDRNELGKPMTDIPLLFHYGRADATVSFYGSNISPTDVQEAIFKYPELAEVVNSYCMEVEEGPNGEKKLIIHIERWDSFSKGGLDKVHFFDMLCAVNQDFREARRMLNTDECLALNFHQKGEGPFAHSDIRIKAHYIH